jgi:hypothetical protein
MRSRNSMLILHSSVRSCVLIKLRPKKRVSRPLRMGIQSEGPQITKKNARRSEKRQRPKILERPL